MEQQPPAAGSGEVTRLLLRWTEGDRAASDALVPLVYGELRRMARSYLFRERSAHTLQPTALVHEAYLRLADDSVLQPRSRTHFFGIASTVMRRVLVEHARARGAAKRGGSVRFEPLDAAGAEPLRDLDDLLDLHEALDELSSMDARKGRLVELKFFGGLTVAEMADVAEVSTATVERDLRVAQVWLHQRLRGDATA